VELGTAAAMGGEAVRTARARTPGEFAAALDSFAHPADLVLIEVIADRSDTAQDGRARGALRPGTCFQVTGDNCLLICAALTPSAGWEGG
jgi:thiamine pyrophosphate-dependent acetolactate synthase large subunit-like protein